MRLRGRQIGLEVLKGALTNMTELELRKKATFEIAALFRDRSVPDEEIIRQIREEPELVHVKCLSGSNLFLDAVLWDRFPVAKALVEMGADIHWTCEASMIHGNALGIAHSPEQAEWLLEQGVAVERNLLPSKPLKNPTVVAAERSDAAMLLYWLGKQRKLFAEDPEYLGAVFHAAINMVSTMNQYNMLSRVIADEELFGILKKIYAQAEHEQSIRLYLGALRHIKDESLEARKKELRKVLNARKKELSAAAQIQGENP